MTEKLDQLLEDALDDLLICDSEVKGKPDIEESLKKISQSEKSGSKQSDSSSPRPEPSAGVLDEEGMNRFFANMTDKLKEMPQIDPDEAQARISESMPQIFDLMQNLLSKELLYPALKDLAPKFDEWLKKNLASLSKDDRRRYKKQISKIHEIIDVFDNESIDNQEKFEKNLELMEQMQALGAPPDELTVPEGMNRCSIM